jgi:hypothetical protein
MTPKDQKGSNFIELYKIDDLRSLFSALENLEDGKPYRSG